MRHGCFFALTFACLTLIGWSEQTKANPLIGAWEISESKWNNEASQLPEPRAVKIYSTENVMYSYYDLQKPDQVLIGAGSYSYVDGVVSETISNHSNKEFIGSIFKFEIIFKNGLISFTCSQRFLTSKLPYYIIAMRRTGSLENFI